MPMGKWHPKWCIPMGFLGSTDWVQATMNKIYKEVLDKINIYLNKIGLFHTNWNKHIAMINLVLTRSKKTDLRLIH
jgi:hypothetical protein